MRLLENWHERASNIGFILFSILWLQVYLPFDSVVKAPVRRRDFWGCLESLISFAHLREKLLQDILRRVSCEKAMRHFGIWLEVFETEKHGVGVLLLRSHCLIVKTVGLVALGVVDIASLVALIIAVQL